MLRAQPKTFQKVIQLGAYFCSENIKSKPIETADNCLLDVESEGIQCPQCWEQQSGPSGTEHVDVDCLAFRHPNFHLNVKRMIIMISSSKWSSNINWKNKVVGDLLNKLSMCVIVI